MSRNQFQVVATSFVILGLVYPALFTFSIYLIAISDDMSWGRTVISGSLGILILISGLSSPIIGRLCDKFGTRRIVRIGGLLLGNALFFAGRATSPWHFLLLFGFVGGLGVSMSGWVPAVTEINRQSKQWLGTKTAIASMGIGVGMLVGAPFVHFAIESWGWRKAISVESLVIFSGIQIAATLLPQKSKKGLMDIYEATFEKNINGILRVVFRLKEFWLVLVTFLCFNFGVQMWQIHQVAYLLDAQWDPRLAVYVVSFIGIISLPIKAFTGFSTDRFGGELTFTLGFLSLIAAVFVLIKLGDMPNWRSGLYLYAVLFTIAYSVIAPLFPAIASNLFKGPNYGVVYGLLTTGSSLGSALGVYGGGIIFDLTGNYNLGLILTLLLGFLATIAVWIAAPRGGVPNGYLKLT